MRRGLSCLLSHINLCTIFRCSFVSYTYDYIARSRLSKGVLNRTLQCIDDCRERYIMKLSQKTSAFGLSSRTVKRRGRQNPKMHYSGCEKKVSITDPSRELGSFFRAGARRTNTRYGNYRSNSNARPRSPPQTLRDR